jgi:tetratricopeptide (TPR) repeat protein
MTAENPSRFDVDTLRALAGEKLFARGEAYHHAGQVEILSLDPERVLARVVGSTAYRTLLIGRGSELDGECSCPAFEDWGFCKHMVAAALTANAAEENDTPSSAEALAGIRAHLKAKGVDALVEMLVEQAERDPALFRRLDMAATAASDDETVLRRRFRDAINAATRTRRFIDDREAPAWAGDVDAVLDSLADLASSDRAGLARELAEHAISRIERAIEEIDDSDGHCGTLLHLHRDRARDIHLMACRVARPDPVILARDLFAREMAEDYDTFHLAAALYADVLGEDGLAEYRRLAADAWEMLPPRAGGGQARPALSGEYFRLAGMLDFFAERDGDVDARIAIRAKDLSAPWQYRQLVEFCLAQGREREALRYAEEGLWVFEDARPDERLVFCAADLLVNAGRQKDAAAHLWHAFEKAPSLALYRRLRKLDGAQARDRALAHLEAQILAAARASGHFPSDLLIRILLEEKMFDRAWTVVHAHGAYGELKEKLARASEATHPREALRAYAERVEDLVKAGGNRNYEAACTLVIHMAGLRGSAEQAAYVADLKARFRRKRNFMKMLR